jgi:hypothetical protein
VSGVDHQGPDSRLVESAEDVAEPTGRLRAVRRLLQHGSSASQRDVGSEISERLLETLDRLVPSESLQIRAQGRDRLDTASADCVLERANRARIAREHGHRPPLRGRACREGLAGDPLRLRVRGGEPARVALALRDRMLAPKRVGARRPLHLRPPVPDPRLEVDALELANLRELRPEHDDLVLRGEDEPGGPRILEHLHERKHVCDRPDPCARRKRGLELELAVPA